MVTTEMRDEFIC